MHTDVAVLGRGFGAGYTDRLWVCC